MIDVLIRSDFFKKTDGAVKKDKGHSGCEQQVCGCHIFCLPLYAKGRACGGYFFCGDNEVLAGIGFQRFFVLTG